MNKTISTICFDYYQTLVQIDAPFQRIEQWLYEFIQNNYKEIDDKKFCSRLTKFRVKLSTGQTFLTGIDLLAQSFEQTCNYFEVSCPKKEFVNFIEELFIMPEAYCDAKYTIENLRKNFTVGLLTNADNHILKSSILKNSFEFDFIITSEDAKANKPDERIFNYALERLRKKPHEVVMVGDSQMDDIYGAGRMNMSTIWVNRERAELKEGIPLPSLEVCTLKEILNKLI
ncbi:MAG: HAD family hydrolase [Bacillota bacterium]